MSENNISLSHLSAAMASADTEQFQTANTPTITFASSPGADLYFHSAVIAVGVVGTAANALILYAMVASKQHKKQILIFNQNVFDLCSSLLLAITYALRLCNIRDQSAIMLCCCYYSR